jgi:hypothetical protein
MYFNAKRKGKLNITFDTCLLINCAFLRTLKSQAPIRIENIGLERAAMSDTNLQL